MSLETIHIILNVIMVFAALYLICIAAFTYGLFVLSRPSRVISTEPRTKREGSGEISILIAARNEGKNIEKLLQSLYNQSFSKEKFEVIIIDDHSDDETFEVSENFRVLHP